MTPLRGMIAPASLKPGIASPEIATTIAHSGA